MSNNKRQDQQPYYYFYSGEDPRRHRLTFCGTLEWENKSKKWKIRVGIAKCDHIDRFQKNVGRKIARERIHDTSGTYKNPGYQDEFFVEDYGGPRSPGRSFARFCSEYSLRHGFSPDRNVRYRTRREVHYEKQAMMGRTIPILED